MDHMTFMTIFSLLATAGMVLLIMWGMTWTHRANVKRPNNPSTYQLVGRKGCAVSDTRSRQGKEVPHDVPTVRWIDGAREV
jgi:hypothetical protein